MRFAIACSVNDLRWSQTRRYFFELWDRLMATNSPWEPDSYARPSYFWFLTLLAFHVFLCEKVDIAIIEVGAGK